ncbi:hypothetical protein HaMNV_gp123 [Helicoverpa armigera multiple nucleopolyhedrovirus]|uniref:Orf123 n=2 Tax=Alphabaculovirus TaxID=558016 RepID=I3XMD9_NPVMB|nr:hypothetical protein McnBVgp129 [Mamestra configurata nucleopolyhedrovirus B]YP_009011186.1 hypothetical protein [Mamestra brassicae multiple nucleopolyhedrovirus]ACH88645.1 hypothetical protein HaMNV_gp123 [Helicoverpa armigera multiple nucleopolyhedrovirus]WNA17503.1 hypothetical protein [Alphabaculovirus mabrassicae]AAM95116.1 hypothetical protein [Mamestra configurata nucleopolyhedrovirus B]AFL64972.1 hypothetical protein [Mamestra brassicae multiple nucleopolyhedrovirus]AFP95842.1 Mab
MSSENATTKRCSTRKSTSGNKDSGGRRVDTYDQIVYCEECGFVSPMSVSFEEYTRLHRRFNFILERVCDVEREIVVPDLIKLNDSDSTV